MADAPFRVLPKLTPLNEPFWTGGEYGELRFLRCADCRRWVHPPQPVCPGCYGKRLEPEAVSGRARVYSFTVNHQAWIPGLDDPYVIAIVAIDEDHRPCPVPPLDLSDSEDERRSREGRRRREVREQLDRELGD